MIPECISVCLFAVVSRTSDIDISRIRKELVMDTCKIYSAGRAERFKGSRYRLRVAEAEAVKLFLRVLASTQRGSECLAGLVMMSFSQC